MARIGAGPWDSDEVQHDKTRKALLRLVAPQTRDKDRLRLARRLLRDAPDLVACMVMSAFRAQADQPDPPLAPVLPALRFRARRILAGESRQQGRDHREALALLVHAPHVSDLPTVLDHLGRRGEDAEAWRHAVRLAGALLPFLDGEDAAGLRAALTAHAGAPDLSREDLDALRAAGIPG